jgi:hypothetical protein
VTGRLLQVAKALVRCWTAVYTWRMPPELRDARRAEIDSDLWECQQEGPSNASLPLQIVARLVLGMPDDLGWRSEYRRPPLRAAQVTWALAAAITGAAVFTVIWLGRAQSLPVPPPLVRAAAFTAAPPPPPPPPPPCPPPGTGAPAVTPCTPF